MTDLAGSKKFIQSEEANFRMPVSENLAAKMGGSINFLLGLGNIILSVQNTAGTSFTTGSESAVPFSTVNLDPSLGWDGIFYTIPLNGNYLVISKTNSTHGGLDGGDHNTLRIKRNGSIIISEDREDDALGKTWGQELCIAFVTLAQYDTINATMAVVRGAGPATLSTAAGSNILVILKIG